MSAEQRRREHARHRGSRFAPRVRRCALLRTLALRARYIYVDESSEQITFIPCMLHGRAACGIQRRWRVQCVNHYACARVDGEKDAREIDHRLPFCNDATHARRDHGARFIRRVIVYSSHSETSSARLENIQADIARVFTRYARRERQIAARGCRMPRHFACAMFDCVMPACRAAI